ncbi:hypothetical protein [Streptomyces montanus]|uniref:hypothetical protein n=1 Tax=Streptomyces montanus TaxID=2580423 RepID=UPI001BB121B1|nr:hypothetical protein [Streptomyces montanus]
MVDLSPQTGPDALNAYDVTVSEDAVTVGTYISGAEIGHESVPKLYQFAADGSPGEPDTRKGRVSCSRGEQGSAAAWRAARWCGWTRRPASPTW